MNTNFGSLQSHISKMNLKMNLIFKILPSLLLRQGWDCPFSQNSRVEQEQRQCLSPSISSPPISSPLLSQTAHKTYFLVAFPLILELTVGKSRTTWDLVWVVQFTETPVTCDDLFPESPWRQELSRQRTLEGSVHCPCRPLWGQLDLLEILVECAPPGANSRCGKLSSLPKGQVSRRAIFIHSIPCHEVT